MIVILFFFLLGLKLITRQIKKGQMILCAGGILIFKRETSSPLFQNHSHRKAKRLRDHPAEPVGVEAGRPGRLPPAMRLRPERPRRSVLLDTGWDSRCVRERPRRFFGLLNGISTPALRDGESVGCHLERLGLQALDLDYIFFSHMDFDHTSGLRLVKDAKHIMAEEEEIADSKRYFYCYVKTNWDFADVQPFLYEDTGIGPVGKSYDVFGDGSVVLVNTPGTQGKTE